MTPTTYAVFVASLAALEIAGIEAAARLAYPPASVPTVPCSFPMLPNGTEKAMTIEGQGGWPLMRCDLIVLYQAMGQSTPESSFIGCLETMDAISAALRSFAGVGLGKRHINWSMRQAVVTVGANDYWAVITTVEGSG